jgi:hypothetical protein
MVSRAVLPQALEKPLGFRSETYDNGGIHRSRKQATP